MRKKLIVLVGVLGSATLSCFFYFSAQAEISHPVISQVQISGSNSNDDFVELFNPTGAPFNLKGIRLVKRTAKASADSTLYVWTTDSFIQPGGFYLWAHASTSLLAIVPDALSAPTPSISSSNGVGLRAGDENTSDLLDSVAWGDTSNGFILVTDKSPSAGKALLKQNLYVDDKIFVYPFPDSNPRNITSAIVLEPTPTPTPTPTPEPTPTVESTPTPTPTPSPTTTAESLLATSTKSTFIKISEVLPNPSGSESTDEAVELVNTSAEDVNVAGWYLDDKSDTGQPKTGAYRFPDPSTVPAGGFLVAKGGFSLNNTGGDTVNLYYADKALADSVSYVGDAQTDYGYQVVNSAWGWAPATLGGANASPPPVVTSGGGGFAAPTPTPTIQSTSSPVTSIKITEILPNPSGDDAGKEWVELYNAFGTEVSLAGFILDDSSSSTTPQSGSWTLDASAVVPANGYLALTIPEDRFTLNNSGSDSVRLFDRAKKLVQEVAYKDAPEGKSYSLGKEGKWVWSVPTPKADNVTEAPDYKVTISEILPNPAEGDEEFVELFNGGTIDVPLKDLVIMVGNTKSNLSGDTVIKPGAYAVLYGDDVNFRLSNSGQTVSVLDAFGRELDRATYPKATQGQSYSSMGSGYAWSDLPTPGESNVLVLGEDTGEQPSVKTTASSKPKTSGVTLTQLRQENKKLEDKIDQLEQELAGLTVQIQAATQAAAVPVASAEGTQDAAVSEEQAAEDDSVNRFTYLYVSLGSLLLLATIIKLVFFKTKDYTNQQK